MNFKHLSDGFGFHLTPSIIDYHTTSCNYQQGTSPSLKAPSFAWLRIRARSVEHNPSPDRIFPVGGHFGNPKISVIPSLQAGNAFSFYLQRRISLTLLSLWSHSWYSPFVPAGEGLTPVALRALSATPSLTIPHSVMRPNF